MNPKNIAAASILAAAVLVGSVELVVGEKSVVTVLIRYPDGGYEYRERIATQKSEAPDDIEVTRAGEAVVDIFASAPCAGGNEVKCLANEDTAKVSPCVRARGPDCFRLAPGDSKPRFFGLRNTFYASEASGTQCEPTPCVIVLGDKVP